MLILKDISLNGDDFVFQVNNPNNYQNSTVTKNNRKRLVEQAGLHSNGTGMYNLPCVANV
jgi:hypothetical protein